MKNVFVLSIVLFSLVVFIASCSKKAAPAEKSVDAAAIFSQNCARCHGPGGKDGRAPSLVNTDMKQDELKNIITNGHDHMPEFGDKLSATEINALSKWILTLKS